MEYIITRDEPENAKMIGLNQKKAGSRQLENEV
ncbi:MAG: hypothetical protein ACJAZ9_001668 [Neolewinella sp.]|jgi:hypothetical protein